MTVSRPAALRSDPAAVEAPAPRMPSGCVVPFAAPARPRRRLPVGEPRGEVVLFLGVRYERLAS